jgi:hypothetical protein
MANLTLNLGSPVTGNYRVSFRNDEGNLLTSSYLTQNQVINLLNSSTATIAIGNGVYTLDNINIRLEAVSDTMCKDDITTNLVVNCPSTICTVAISNVSESCVSNTTSIVVAVNTSGSGTLEYGLSTTIGVAPTSWQSINQFNQLLKNNTYYIYVRNTENPSLCITFTSYTTGSCLPNCGCSNLSSFSVDSITKIGSTTSYNIAFNACSLTSGNWRVKNSTGTIMTSGTIIPTSSVLTIDFGTLAPATYTFELDSNACLGQTAKTFVVTTPVTCSQCFELISGNCVPILNCGGGSGTAIAIEDFIVDAPIGKTISFSLSGGNLLDTVTIDLKQGSSIVGTLTAAYSSTMTVTSSQYGYVDAYIDGNFKSSIYLPLRLTTSFSVKESKAVNENDGFMKLVYTQQPNGEFLITDSASPSVSNIYYNVNGKWRNNLSGLKLEPLTNHSITKYAYNGAYWGDNSAAQSKKQISFRIVSASPTLGADTDAYESIWLGGLNDIINVGTVLVGGNKKTAIDNWRADGGNMILFTVEWAELEQVENILDVLTLNKVKALLNYIINVKGMKAYLKFQMSVGTLNPAPAHTYDPVNDGMRMSNGAMYSGSNTSIPMTLSSGKITNMDRFWNLVSNEFSGYANNVIVAVTQEENQELQYPISSPGGLNCDYHPTEIAAWNTWQTSVYGNVLSAPLDYNGTAGKRWLKFKGYQLKKFAKRWGAIFKAKGFNTVYDCGSLTDSIGTRGVWAVPTSDLRPEIDGLKDNPDYWDTYNIEMEASLCHTYNNNLSILEDTYNPSQNVSTNVNRIYNSIRRAKTGGIKISNFSFFSNYHDTGSPNYQVASQVLALLNANNFLHKRRLYPTNSCATLTFEADVARTGGGYQSAYNNTYNSAYASCGSGTNGYPKVVIIDNL